MNVENFKAYDIDETMVEIYDQTETQTEDVQLLRELIGASSPRKILEPFCGNGCILIPLACDGHTLSAPLGVPASFMADPEDVGRKLAAKIGSRKPIVTPDLTVSAGVLMSNLFPRLMGGFLSGKAAEARSKTQS